jgi:hypothetical protein
MYLKHPLPLILPPNCPIETPNALSNFLLTIFSRSYSPFSLTPLSFNETCHLLSVDSASMAMEIKIPHREKQN